MTIGYALIGAGGYIAPRHLAAIKDTGGDLGLAYDINDSVGIIDSYFPNADFFTEFEEFEYAFQERKHSGNGIDYVSICSPNHLHKSHIGFALRSSADAICEKPLVLAPKDLDDLANLERQTGQNVNTILQLRVHPSIIALKKKIDNGAPDKIYDVDLGYFTSRGRWYHASWKGVEQKSGGIATNIGVHFFDMLGFLFGKNTQSALHHRDPFSSSGYLEFEKARVRWVLSINRDHLPSQTPPGQYTYRSITVDGEEIEFSGGFTDLHTTSYERVHAGQGFGIEDVRPAIELVTNFRRASANPTIGDQHPLLKGILSA